MYYIYIIHSAKSDKYYVGYTTNIELRLHSHNYQETFNTYTKKHRPWILRALFCCGESESIAVKLEKFIKKQKSRKLIELLCDPFFIPTDYLAPLVRVPQVRD